MRGISQIELDLALPKSMFKGIIKVVQDSNEQHPFEFDPAHFEVEVRPLAAGDYSICGFEDEFAIERKNGLEELIGWFSGGRDRFYHELALLSKIKTAYIVVERGNLAQIMRGEYDVDMGKSSVVGTINACLARFKVPVFFAESRPIAQHFVMTAMNAFVSKQIEKAKKMAKWEHPRRGKTRRADGIPMEAE